MVYVACGVEVSTLKPKTEDTGDTGAYIMSEPFTITSAENAVELVLSDATVTMRLSGAALDEVHREIQNDPDVQAGNVAGRFARFVTGMAEKMISKTIEYPLTDINDVEFTDGRLVFSYAHRHKFSFEDITVGDHGHTTSVLAMFPPDAANAFVEKFHQLKGATR